VGIPLPFNRELLGIIMKDWWENHLNQYRENGIRDADNGYINVPHPGSDDPQDEAENSAYIEGFNIRRKELGSQFNWKP